MDGNKQILPCFIVISVPDVSYHPPWPTHRSAMKSDFLCAVFCTGPESMEAQIDKMESSLSTDDSESSHCLLS